MTRNHASCIYLQLKNIYIYLQLKATRFLGGFGACSPESFLKNGAIWCVLKYILLQFCQKKIVKKFIFYTKVIDIVLIITAHYIGVLKHTPQNVCLLGNLVRLGINFDYISIKDRGASMGGQSRPLGLPPWKKTFFFLYEMGDGAFFSFGDLLLFFCYLNFLHVLDIPPPPYDNF